MYDFRHSGRPTYVIVSGRETTVLSWAGGCMLSAWAGLGAGVLLQRKRLPVDGITLTVFTLFTIFVIYGGIMNIYAWVHASAINGEALSAAGLRVLYISGVPYDAYHASTAALCVFLFGNSIIRKLERIKIKYGIYK